MNIYKAEKHSYNTNIKEKASTVFEYLEYWVALVKETIVGFTK